MELYGIMLSVPFFYISSSIYSIIIGRITKKLQFLTPPLFWISGAVIGIIFFEFIAVSMFGPDKLQEAIGPSYYSIHFVFFVLAIPGIVHLMKLQTRFPFLSNWPVIGVFCAIFALCIIIQQYAISETLFGINGTR